MKICTTCKKEKSLNDFYKSSKYKDGHGYRCKNCDSIARKAYHDKHYNTVRNKLRINQRKSKYGLSDEDFQLMLAKQHGKCAICEVVLSDEFDIKHLSNKLVIDHCHNNGHVRGLLCTMCNKALGLFKEDILIIEQAFKYLRKTDADIH